jgi:predicted nucleotidyltransferase
MINLVPYNDLTHPVLLNFNEEGRVISMMKYVPKTPQSYREEMCAFLSESNKRVEERRRMPVLTHN